MRPLTLREQIIAVATGALLLFVIVFYGFGLGDALDRMGLARRQLAMRRAEYEEARESLRYHPQVVAEYAQYARYSLPVSSNADPADEFSNYVNGVIRELGFRSTPLLRPTEYEPIEGVPNYQQILLPLEFTAELGQLVELLREFDRQRLLIQAMRITTRLDDPVLSVTLTLSRFVPVEQPTASEAPAEEAPAAPTPLPQGERGEESAPPPAAIDESMDQATNGSTPPPPAQETTIGAQEPQP